MKTIQFEMTGTAPLLMHNQQLADPRNKIARAMKEITSKRKKTDADLVLLQDLEWIGGMYVTNPDTLEVQAGAPAGGGVPAIHGSMIEAMLIEASRAKRNGKSFTAGVFCPEHRIPLIYDGPRDLAKLMETPRFREVAGVKVNKAKIMRTRPRFENWGIKGEIAYNETVVSGDDVREAFRRAGEIVGIGDWRPKFGRFTVEFVS